ncbi:hypothetical protein GJ688_04740 [Heliobacillus mobilis]|uniref:Uncharacterized protein n=1 Tax=Heliobacterium mobile TaxID=28064 RepID=A0A6I3SHG9_HELMO|nr:S-layer homology domain-containing protein [Heliobacterium mobile]MTV48290.1 hypothetical protein [Heliobacterium mobile]
MYFRNLTYKISTTVFLIIYLFHFIPVASFASSPSSPGIWPTVWVPYTLTDGSIICDPHDESPDGVDLTSGISNNLSSVYLASDGSNMFFRFRLRGNPRYTSGGNNGSFNSSGGYWQVELADASSNTHKVTVGVAGKQTDEVYVIAPNATNETKVYDVPANDSLYTRVTQDPTTGEYYLDYQVPISYLSNYGITATTSIKLFFGTSTTLQKINKDFMINSAIQDSNGIVFSQLNVAQVKPNSIPTYGLPSVSIDSASLSSSSSTPTVTGSFKNADQVLVTVSNSSYNATLNSSNNTWAALITSRLSNGIYPVTIMAKDTSSGCYSEVSGNLVVNASVGVPTVTTDSTVSNVTATGATVGGNVTSDGNATIMERGIVVSTQTDPSTSDTKVAASSAATGTFTVNLTGLEPATTYHYRAYATNSQGTSYGADQTFTTAPASNPQSVPTVTTDSTVSNVTATGATVGGNVTSDGNATITERGVVVSTQTEPSTSDTKVTASSAVTGTFTVNLTGLEPATTYHYRAYATNSQGTSYGADQAFTTAPASNPQSVPTVTTDSTVSNVTAMGATVGGNVTSDGNATITERGIVVSTQTDPSTSDTKVAASSAAIGTFTVNLTGLEPATTYHYRAYATNNQGTSYGSDKTFTTVVPAKEIYQLTVDEYKYSLTVGTKHSTTVTAIYSDQSVQDVTTKATYRSSNENIVTVDTFGNIQAVSQGNAVITISYEGITVFTQVFVSSMEPGFVLDLQVSPDTIVGDGNSVVSITAKLTATSNSSVEGVPVEFNFTKYPVYNNLISTDSLGIAKYTFKAPNIQSVTPVLDSLTVRATDIERNNLQVEKSINIRFMPAMVKGVVVDQVSGKPVEGATVSLTADFNNDGVTDFSSTTFTDSDGSYEVYVPRGNWIYTLNIQTPVKIGDKIVLLNSTQTASVGQLDGSEKTVDSTNKISGQLLVASSNSDSPLPTSTLSDLFGIGHVSVKLKSLSDNIELPSFPIDENGNFEVNNVQRGTYQIIYQITGPNGETLAGPTSLVSVNQDGEMSIVYSLIDPYGIVTDSDNHQPVSGVTVKLYWADTALNRQNHHIPNTMVNLPELPNFAPNLNHNPQVTNSAGEYAWMVYPNGDYYVIATKDAYKPYSTLDTKPNAPATDGSDSFIRDGIIHVGQNLVSLNFNLTGEHRSSSNSGSGSSSPKENAAITITTSKRSIYVGDSLVITATVIGKNASGFVTFMDGEVQLSDAVKLQNGMVVFTTSELGVGTHSITAVYNGDMRFESAKSQTVSVDVNPKLQNGEHQKYINGYPDGEFKPAKAAIRADLAMILYRTLNLYNVISDDVQYNDISKSYWGTKAILAVTKAGYMNGYPDGTFRPNQPISREEMASLVSRVRHLPDGNRGSFIDVEDGWAKKSINAASSIGVIKGYPDGTFHPKTNVTRGEAVTLINRMLNRGPLTEVQTDTWPDVDPSNWAFGDIEEASTDHEYTFSNGVERLVETAKK